MGARVYVVLGLMISISCAGCDGSDSGTTSNPNNNQSSVGPSETAVASTDTASPEDSSDDVLDESIFTVTDGAAKELESIFEGLGQPSIRVTIQSGGSRGLQHDIAFENQYDLNKDVVVDTNGVKIIFEKPATEYIKGSQLVWKVLDTGEEGFWIENPNTLY